MIGHGWVLHSRVASSSGHAMPPCAAAIWIFRERDCVEQAWPALQHDLGQTDHAVHLPTAQSMVGGVGAGVGAWVGAAVGADVGAMVGAAVGAGVGHACVLHRRDFTSGHALPP